ncbi:Trs120-domain-containing protein [Xylariaceae sp. FL0594]|nr:Trs120-domain-containing protein [Xylariaceae sp. FL0594]
MSLDSLRPVAPARVRALVLPIGQIKRERFQSFVRRLSEEHVVQLRDISADGRSNRNMFSPLAFPDGTIFYDLITHMPPPSHLSLSPFDLFREPLAIIAIADGKELEDVAFSKRQSANGYAPTMAERNIRTLYQELEELRDTYPKMLTHHVLIFDHKPPNDGSVPMPEGIKAIPPPEQSKRTTMKTVMCDISSLLLAEMTTLAKSFEAMTTIDSPGHTTGRPDLQGVASWTSDDAATAARRNSQFAIPSVARSASSSGTSDRSQSRMSMPPFKSNPFGSNGSSSGGRPSTPVRSGLSNPPTTFDDIASATGANVGLSSPEQKEQRNGQRSGSIAEENGKPSNHDRVSVHGFGPGGLNEKWRNKGRGRATILVGYLYLQAGRWPDALKELIEGATVAKSINDHLWHGKALELISLCLLLLAWAGHEFQVPAICLPPNDKASNSILKAHDAEETQGNQPRHIRNFQIVLPDLLERIVGLYTRISGEQLPPYPLSETIIRFCNTLIALHLSEGRLSREALEMVVLGRYPTKMLDTSPRLSITPSRGHISGLLFKAFPSSATELLTPMDRAIILSGIATSLGTLGYHRKKAFVVRELLSVLIGGLIEARTRGAAEVGIHPAAGLVASNTVNGHGKGAEALDLDEGDLEHGIDAFLGLLCSTYGVVGFESSASPPGGSPSPYDTDERVISRINSQSDVRQFGFPSVKLDILRACINFSEALPDFQGVLKFSGDLLRTAGSGVAPGPRREDAAPIIMRDEQVRLVTNITKTCSLSQRMGLGRLTAEYWDEFLIRGITLDPLPISRTPTLHSKNVLPGVTTARTSQDVNPFIYNPFLRTPEKVTATQTLVANEPATFRIVIQNPFEVDLEIDSISLHAEGAEFDSAALPTVIGPYRTQILKIHGTPRAAGSLKITGADVQVHGCRRRRFPIFTQSWRPKPELKVKGIGLGALKQSPALPRPGPPLTPDSLQLSVIDAQPTVVVKATSLPQTSVMILEGERRVFSVTLHNTSPTTPVDLLLFSFQDSTQAPLQAALASRDATPAELYEYEWVLARKQALRLRKIDDSKRYIAPGSTATFEFEILGKPGLTKGMIQIDYAHLGVPQSEVKDKFFTRQVCLDLTVTVNASIEVARVDVLPVRECVPGIIWSRTKPDAVKEPAANDDFCLLVMDLRNAWPSDMQVCLESGKDIRIEEHILPGNTNRIVVPAPRVYVEDQHAPIPALNSSRQRQFVVSSSKITPDMERTTREAFWYREKMLGTISGTWKTLSGPTREGMIELRNIRPTPRMIEAMKIDEIGIDISVEDVASGEAEKKNSVIFVDEPVQIKVLITNRTSEPVYPTVRVMPALCNRPVNVALDFTRKFAWNGTLQQTLPLLGPKSSAEVRIGATALCRGVFEISASVEETRLWEATPSSSSSSSSSSAEADKKKTSNDDTGAEEKERQQRNRAGTQSSIVIDDALLGTKQRRIWHSRRPCVVAVHDGPGLESEDEE